MPLPAGSRLGPYEIVSAIGAGGMGEVYRARDTRLHRDVAIKTLPSAFTLDADRRARFEREAQVLASLNHPNIAAIYGVEDAGEVRGLVMELVDGATLADLIQRAPNGVPIADALPIARQIVDALEAAHDHGVIHRDLKPANVKVTSGGIVKVLDFGLAKALSTDSGSEGLHDSPTATSPATRAGTVLGTAAYMSPEQARGRPVDKRTDVWAFGCVLYEMLTGRRAFAGDNITDLLAGIVTREVDLGALPAATPAPIRRLIRRCLEKDRTHRLADIADARLEIIDALDARAGPDESATHVPGRRRQGWWPLAIAAAAVVIAAVSVAGWLRARPAPSGSKRFVVVAPASDPMIHESIGNQIAISPDGQHIAYIGVRSGSQIYIRRINQLEAEPIPGTVGARQPFFSPDSRFIGFWATADGEIRRVALNGGPVVTVAKAPSGVFYGASWGADDLIVFGSGSLYRVPASGGTPEPLTTLDPARSEVEHRWPEILPGGQGVLYTAWGGNIDRSRIDAYAYASRERTTLIEGATMPRFAATGHLVYQQSGALLATAFDPATQQTSGRVVQLQEHVKTTVSGAADFAIARDGTLVLMEGSTTPDRRLKWVDRKGAARPLLDTPDDYWLPRLAPDGRRLAVGIGPDLWVIELTRLDRTRVTFGTTNTLFPYTWSRDGRGLLFSRVANKTGLDIYAASADGTGEPELVAEGEHRQWAISVSPVADEIATYEQHPTTLRDIWIIAGGKRRPFLATPYQERVARFSPDGRWIVYVSNDSGRDEVYVRGASGEGRRITVSTDGGSEPAWSALGREIIYRNGSQMMSAAVTSSTPELIVDRPLPLFETTFEADRGSGAANPNYDVTADGQRFVMIQAPAAPTSLIVVINWFEELKTRMNAGAR
jgi:serine/threonine-protein kinase